MNDKQREEFELFWQEKILDAGWTLSKTESYFVWRRAWQAAIASQKALYVATYEQSEEIILNKEFIKD